MVYRCNFCGGKEYNLAFEGKEIIRCKSCGLVSLRTIPSNAELQGLYDKEYSTGESFNQFYTNLSLVRRTDAYLRMRTLAKWSKGRDLLDVGAGLGYYVEAAIEQGWNAKGVEISRIAVLAQSDRRLPILNCSFESYETTELYDAITLWAILEHTPDPRGMLEKAYTLLKPGGILLIETGDLGSHNAKQDGAKWRMFYIAGHLYFFTSNCLDRVLTSIGFTILETRLDKWLEHMLMQNEAHYSLLTANAILPSFVIRSVVYIKYLINHVLARFGLGDVMIKIAQKPEVHDQAKRSKQD
jgi:2-polyprenyl-3-methyl-5-hydroxy-6-metoxy-1,4-benzoquinol methylase